MMEKERNVKRDDYTLSAAHSESCLPVNRLKRVSLNICQRVYLVRGEPCRKTLQTICENND